MAYDLDRLLPMHLRTDADGIIIHAGPTLTKAHPSGSLPGKSVFDVFDIRTPIGVDGIEALRATAGMPLRLSFRAPPRIALRGLLSVGADSGILMNLSFGISILDAIRAHDLHLTDFAITDPSLEILYLVEAGHAAMEETRALTHRLIAARDAAEERAFTDTLTGLHNRRALGPLLARYQVLGLAHTLMGVDLDFFKHINDTYGHAAGDHVLKIVASAMRSVTSEADTLVRTGGDEFLVVLHGDVDLDTAQALGETLIARLEEPIMFEGHTCRISASIGLLASSQCPGAEMPAMLERVDAALYAAKRGGKRQVVRYSEGMAALAPNDGAERLEARVPPGLA